MFFAVLLTGTPLCAGDSNITVPACNKPQANNTCMRGSTIATARVQPAEAPRILCGKQEMMKPSAGRAPAGRPL